MRFEKAKKEMVDVGLITLYFFICFIIFMVIKMLVLFQYNISFYGWGTAMIGALAIGKVVYLIDKSPIQQWLSHLKPIVEILLKAFSYTLLVFLVSTLEKTIRYWLEDPLVGTWWAHIFGRGNGAMIMAHTIYIYFCFVGFFFIHFLTATFGRDKLIDLLTKPRV